VKETTVAGHPDIGDHGLIGGLQTTALVTTNGTVDFRALPPAELDRLADGTTAYWKNRIGRSAYTGRWREMADRSAMTLKLMTYEPTGAPVVAATFGLPEQTGGERTWDYRFTWIRDGSLATSAKHSLTCP
jgi:hypothetical protein